jgi:hypothetical protein
VATNIEPSRSDQVYKPSGQVPAGSMINGKLVRNPLIPSICMSASAIRTAMALDYFFTRRLSEFGPRHSVVERDTFRLATGMKAVRPVELRCHPPTAKPRKRRTRRDR